jgi:hypothetical protein
MIAYKKGFKYQICEEYRANVGIVGYDVKSKDGWVRLKPDGELILKNGFGWDGSSGPTWDNNHDKQSSAEHDALCKLVRWGLLPSFLLHQINERYRDRCIEDGMWKAKARLRFWVLEKCDFYIKPSSRQKIYYAP